MKDLKEAIQLIFHNASPIKLGDLTVGYTVNANDMRNLVAEFNIHFVEPEASQIGLNPYPNAQLNITVDNVEFIER